jgi:hypothetical protein
MVRFSDDEKGANIPLRTAEAEAVGQFTLQRIPELYPLLFRKVEQSVVVLLELFILLHNGPEPAIVARIVAILSFPSIATTATATL